jgi:HNH endonuclease
LAITLRRQLDPDEKALILKRHGRECFATGHQIPKDETVQFDHIRAFAQGGATELDNIAPMCEEHNKMKGALPLEDFRISLRLKEFFKEGDALTLQNLLEFLRKQGDISSFGRNVSATPQNGNVELRSATESMKCTLHKCPTTGWHYFYATLPVEIINSDDTDASGVGLQPRYLIYDKVFELYRHFQNHPVLQPSVGRVSDSKILLFDGQHKIAALLWTGRRNFECKIYLDPELPLLNRTNISAHDTFSQTRFYASIMVAKLGAEFGAAFESYRKLDDGGTKSEAGFLKFLEADPTQTLTRGERNERFRSYLYNSVLQSADNRLTNFISKGNRSSDDKPLTMDQIRKSVFSNFLYEYPVDDDLTSGQYKRDQEIENVVNLMSMLNDQALRNWKPSSGRNDAEQWRLRRLFGSKPMMAWSELLRDAVCAKLDLTDSEDRARPFYRDISTDQWKRIKKIVDRLVEFKIWSSPPDSEVDRVISDKKSAIKEWLKTKGLTTGYLLGAAE